MFFLALQMQSKRKSTEREREQVIQRRKTECQSDRETQMSNGHKEETRALCNNAHFAQQNNDADRAVRQ